MDKQTKLLLGLGLVAVAAYFLFKKPTVPVAKQSTPAPEKLPQEMDYAYLPKPELPNDTNMDIFAPVPAMAFNGEIKPTIDPYQQQSSFNGKNYVDTMKNDFFKTKIGQFSKN